MDEEELIEAKRILAEKRKLLQKYPNRFLLQVDVRKWRYRVAVMEQDEKAMFESMKWGTNAKTP